MKKLLILSLMLMSFSLLAQTKRYVITDSLCGEIDPFLIGDACILTIQESQDKPSHYVIINLDDLMTRYSQIEDFEGMIFVADLSSMDRAEREVRRYLSRWYALSRANKTLVVSYGGEFEIIDTASTPGL